LKMTGKKPASFIFVLFHNSFNATEAKKYQFRVLDAFMILHLKLYIYYIKRPIKHNPIILVH